MSTNFPSGLDSLTNPLASDQLSNPSHAEQHQNANDAIEAMQLELLNMLRARPLEFPLTKEENHHLEAESADPLEVFYKATGNSGIINELQIIIEGQPADFDGMILNIEYDGEETPSVSLPINSLIAMEHPDYLIAPVYENDMVLVNGSTEENQSSAVIRWPIPYTNGIHIYITGLATGSWANVSYQDSLPACWNRNLRFFATRSNESITAPSAGAGTVSITGTAVVGVGTNFTSGDIGKYLITGNMHERLIVAVADTTHCTIADKDGTHNATNTAYQIGLGHIFLNRPTGKSGFLCQINYGIDAALASAMEVNTRLFIDGETQPSQEFSGTEDLYEGSFYWTVPKQNWYGGIVCISTVSGVQAAAYTIFTRRPKVYNDGMVAIQPCMGGATVFNLTSIYYEFQA